MALDKSKFVPRFISEARDHINKLNSGLLHLEKEPGDKETLNEVFRAAHSIKGGAKMLSLKEILAVTHKMEDVLEAMRSGEIKFSDTLFTLLFKAIDVATDILDRMQAGEEIDLDLDGICGLLEKASKESIKQGDLLKDDKKSPQAAKKVKGKNTEESKIKKSPMSKEPKKEKEEKKTVPPAESKLKEDATKGKKTVKTETVHVNIDKLDETINLIGEITSSQSILRQNLADLEEIDKISRKNLKLLVKTAAGNSSQDNGNSSEVLEAYHDLFSRLKLLSAKTRDDMNFHNLQMEDLRDKVLSMRMLPISTILDTFPRLVRDLTAASGKKVELLIEGGETEMDKKIIEKIGDPLIHLMRNCIDHGIEEPAERLKAGKPEKGLVHIRVEYEGGSVLIQISDDGGGIAIDKVRKKALQKRLIDEDRIETVTESELINLIFLPGFSTSPIITEVSGRGVGMDVVKENIIEQLKGDLKIETSAGKGTTFFVRLPLTMAIMRVLVFEVSNLKFAINVNSTEEIIKLQQSELIDIVGKQAMRLREKLIPVAEMSRILNMPNRKERRKDDSEAVILLLSIGDEKLGVIIDTLVSEEDMEIKAMPAHMQHLEMVSGATISGKNEIIIILNVSKIFDSAKELKEEKLTSKAEDEEIKSKHILVVDDSINTREIEQSILEAYGYRVDVASDGMEALERTREIKYDLVVTDVEMPRMDGFTFTEKLRSNSDYKDTPIIIVTSRDKEEDKRRGIQVGADAYIVKGSFDQSNLLETVQYLID